MSANGCWFHLSLSEMAEDLGHMEASRERNQTDVRIKRAQVLHNTCVCVCVCVCVRACVCVVCMCGVCVWCGVWCSCYLFMHSPSPLLLLVQHPGEAVS